MKLQIGAGGTRSCGPSRRHESSSGLASLEPKPEPPAAVRLRGRVAPPGRKPGGPGRREGLDIFVEYSFQDKGRGEIPHGTRSGWTLFSAPGRSIQDRCVYKRLAAMGSEVFYCLPEIAPVTVGGRCGFAVERML